MANQLAGFGPLAAMGYVQQQGDIGRQRGQQERINMLAGQSYSATTPEQQSSLLSQLAQVDPQVAQDQQQQFQSQEDRSRKELYGMAQGWKKVPQQYRQGYYEKYLSPRLAAMGMGEQPAYDEATIDGAADQIIAAFGQQVMGAQPTDVRSFEMMTAGLSPEEKERARRVNLGLEGRASTSGYSQVKFTGADGRERVGVLNGRTGQIDLPDGTSFNPQTGAMSQTSSQVQQAAPAAGLYNTPNGQVRIGEGLTPEQWELVQADMASGGASNNYQLPDRNVTPAQRAASSDAFVGRAPEEQAAAVERAKIDAQNSNFETEIEQQRRLAEQQARIEGEKARAVQQAKSESERAETQRAKSAALNNVTRGVDRVEKALTAIEGMRGADSGPLDQYFVARTKEGQELAAAVGAMQDSMLALTRVPGVGSQSDLEAKLANLKYPDLGNYPTVNRNNVAQLKALVNDLRTQFGSTTSAAPAGNSGPQPGMVEEGYRFRGGNPSDPNNWERI